MKRIIIASALFSAVGMFAEDAGNTTLSTDPIKESLKQKSQEELQDLYAGKLFGFQSSMEYKNWYTLHKQLADLDQKRKTVAYSCLCSQTRFYSWFGSVEDCEKIQEVDHEILIQHAKIVHAGRKLIEANPDLQALDQSILEKEYAAMQCE